jgi:hypothetical protein
MVYMLVATLLAAIVSATVVGMGLVVFGRWL